MIAVQLLRLRNVLGAAGLAVAALAVSTPSAHAFTQMPAQACQERGTSPIAGFNYSEYRLARLTSSGPQSVVCPIPFDVEIGPAFEQFGTIQNFVQTPEQVSITIQDQHSSAVVCRVAGRSGGGHFLSATRSTVGTGLKTLTFDLPTNNSNAMRCDLPPHNVGGYTRLHDYYTH